MLSHECLKGGLFRPDLELLFDDFWVVRGELADEVLADVGRGLAVDRSDGFVEFGVGSEKLLIITAVGNHDDLVGLGVSASEFHECERVTGAGFSRDDDLGGFGLQCRRSDEHDR